MGPCARAQGCAQRRRLRRLASSPVRCDGRAGGGLTLVLASACAPLFLSEAYTTVAVGSAGMLWAALAASLLSVGWLSALCAELLAPL